MLLHAQCNLTPSAVITVLPVIVFSVFKTSVFVFLAHPDQRSDELLPWRSVRRPSVRPSVCPQFIQNASSLSVLDRFQFRLFCLIDLSRVTHTVPGQVQCSATLKVEVVQVENVAFKTDLYGHRCDTFWELPYLQ